MPQPDRTFSRNENCHLSNLVCLFSFFFFFLFFFLFSVSFSFVWGMCVINVTDCELWTLKLRIRRPKDSAVHVRTFFSMKITGVCLSFSGGWLTKEWEWEVHLGVPCLFVIYCWNQEDVERYWRLQIEPITLSPYLELWRVPLPLIPTLNRILKNYHSLLPCLNQPKSLDW